MDGFLLFLITVPVAIAGFLYLKSKEIKKTEGDCEAKTLAESIREKIEKTDPK